MSLLIEDLVKSAEKEIEKLAGKKFFVEFKKFGDFSTSAPLRVAGELKTSPEKIAQDWEKQINVEGVRTEAKGGFINFFLTENAIKENLENLTSFRAGGETVVIDFSSPNIAKPFSVGHLRSTIIGDSLRRINEALGNRVVMINFFGDWGTQFGKLLAAYELWGKDINLKEEPIKKLFQLYVKFHREAENNPELEDRAREWFRKLENGDRKALEIWEMFKKISLEEFNRLYGELGTTRNYVYAGESLFVKDALRIVNELLDRGIAVEDDGAVIVPLEDRGLPPLLLRKKDGTTIYAARDIASAVWRTEKFKADRLLYVVGGEQKLHFKQIFAVLDRMGITVPKEHVWFGMVRLPEGKMSTRKGRVIFLEDVLNEAVSRVKSIMAERGETDEKVAKTVGIGAVKFADLKNNRTRDVVFTWDILRLDGETGPYVQYACVRAKKIVQKANFEPEFGKLDENERELAMKLVKLRISVLDAARYSRPDIIANHLLDIADSFNKFYEKFSVLKSARPQRLYVVKKVADALEFGLNLLGIDVPDSM